MNEWKQIAINGMRFIYALTYVFTIAGCSGRAESDASQAPINSPPKGTVNSTETLSGLSTNAPNVQSGPSASTLRLINAAYIRNAWRPLLGPTIGSRLVFISDNRNLTVFPESSIRLAAAMQVPSYEGNLRIATTDSFPTFDFNGDGIADFTTIETVASSTVCDDGKVAMNRSISIFSGNSLSTVLYKSGAIQDLCIPINGGATAQSPSLHLGALQYGAYAGIFSLVPQFYNNGWFAWSTGAAASHFYTPNTVNYASYINAKPMLQPSALGLSYQALGTLSGIVVSYNGGARYVARSSGRFLQYAIGPFSNMQLIGDAPFLARADLVGRSYGVLQHDIEGNPAKVLLISGTHSADLFQDLKKGYASGVVTGWDIWGGIERHVSVYDIASNQVEQKFYSYAHDNANGNTYRNRVTYPPYARVPSQNAAGSRLVYNVFDGTTWSIHFSTPGGTGSPAILADYYVWDIIRRDKDTVDVITSPIDKMKKIWIPNYVSVTGTVGSWRQETYFPQLKTVIFRWTRQAEYMVAIKTISGGIPYMDIPFPNAGYESTGGYLFPSIRGLDSATKTSPVLILYRPDGTLFEAAMEIPI